MVFQTFKITLNSVANVHHRFVTSFPLRYAARQSRAFSDKHAVFVRFNRHAKFRAATLTIAGAVRNATLCGGHSRHYSGVEFVHRKRSPWNLLESVQAAVGAGEIDDAVDDQRRREDRSNVELAIDRYSGGFAPG
jgi:hypothetical protein